MECPKCKNNINPLLLFRVTRWTDIVCSRCTSRLNRELNGQFWLMNILGSIFSFILLIPFLIFGVFWGFLVSIVLLFMFLYLDAKTTRLVLSKRNKT